MGRDAGWEKCPDLLIDVLHLYGAVEMTGRSTTCAGTRRLVPADARLLFFCARWDEQVKQRPSRPAQVRLRQSGERDRWTDGQRVERPAPRGGKEARGLRTLGHDFFYPSWERKADKGSRVDIRQQGTRSGVRRARRAGICRMAQSLPCLSQLAQLADGEVEWNWRDGGRGAPDIAWAWASAVRARVCRPPRLGVWACIPPGHLLRGCLSVPCPVRAWWPCSVCTIVLYAGGYAGRALLCLLRCSRVHTHSLPCRRW